MSDRRLLFKFASRGRPLLFERGLRSILENAVSSSLRVLCSLDSDDPSLVDYWRSVEAVGDAKVRVCVGRSLSKVDAINRDVLEFHEPWDILVNMSDDMVFTARGFDDVIRHAFGQGLDRFVHFNDGNQGSSLCTMSVLGREYFKRFGYIYHPSYSSLWCDVEAHEVAKELGRYVYMGDAVSLFRHLHPEFGLAPNDARYEDTNNAFIAALDAEVYRSRKAAGFPANPVTTES